MRYDISVDPPAGPPAKVARTDSSFAEGTPLADQVDLSVTSFRYFTPSELLRLFGFQCSAAKPFVFPEDVPLRKQYELIGNSVSVDVIRQLLVHVLKESHYV